MIIKKKYAQTNTSTPAQQNESISTLAVPQQHDPYEMAQAEDFEAGKVQERRRTDRRHGYRRVEDQEVISRAHEEANAIRESAAQEGYEEGIAQANTVIEELSGVMQNFLDAREEALNSAADALGSMAIEIAERLIKTEVSCDPSLVMHLVRQTIAKVGREQKSITIKVNPIDVKLVKETMKTDSQISESVEILVVEDESVDPGSCMLETQAGLIDARFSTQLEVLKHLLLTGGKA